jgi:hypothetical protein
MTGSTLPGQRLVSIFLLLLGAGCSRTEEQVLYSDGLYAVFEVEPVRGEVTPGQPQGPVRVAVVGHERQHQRVGEHAWVDSRPMKCLAFNSCDEFIQKRGALTLRYESTQRDILSPEALDAWRVGEERLLRRRELNFRVFHKEGDVLNLYGTEASPAEARVRLVKKCPATLRIMTYDQRGRPGGIIAGQGEIHTSWTELKKPECFAPEDLEYERLSEEERAARERALAEPRAAELQRMDEGDDQVRRQQALRLTHEQVYRQERFAAFQARAAEYARQHPPGGPGWDALSSVEHALNPEQAGLLRAAGIEELRLEPHCVRWETRKGRARRCKSERTLLLVRWAKGESRFLSNQGNQERAKSLTRAWVDERGWLQVEPGPKAGTLSDARLLSTLREVLTFVVRDVKLGEDPDPRRLPLPRNWSFVSPRE